MLYTFPDRKRLAGELLDKEYEHVQGKVDKMLALLDYVQFSSDGWSNIRGESIVSYVATCFKGDYYIDSTDASLVEKKGADWCFLDFKRVVAKAKIPFSKISGLVTDTEAKMRALWQLVEKDYPMIFAYGCCTHTIQLILKDICALPWFAAVCTKCNQVAKWFCNRHLPAGLLKKTARALKLKVERPVRNCTTRFASWVYVVERIQALKKALRVVVDDALYIARCLKKKGRDDDPEDKEPSAIINDPAFWNQVTKFLEVLVPVRVFLRYTDTRFSLACRIYEGFSNLSNKVEKLELGDGFTEEIRAQVIGIITSRWTDVHHDVHAAGYMLDPTNIKVDVSSNKELNDGFERVLSRLLSKEEKKAAKTEWAKYKELEGFAPDTLDLTDTSTATGFWKSYCGHFPTLQKKVAPRILSLQAGTRCVESHFSVMGAVHSKSRPRLINSKVRKLTAIVTNTKMLAEAEKPGFGQQEIQKAVMGSDSDSDSESEVLRDGLGLRHGPRGTRGIRRAIALLVRSRDRLAVC